MSGPIVRKYGFPNFEKIFGERPLEHGVENDQPDAEQGDQARSADTTKKKSPKKKTKEPKKK